jgi:phosphoribosylaminoimidazole-succinocarboxamide synthase
MNTITQLNLPGVPKLKSGKVREVFDFGDALLFVATDRLSAFDVILPNPIPDKGRVLTALSEFWFSKTSHIVENHVITSDFKLIAGRCSGASAKRRELEGRSMLVRKCNPLAIECVVRGYLAGSGWKEYKQSRTVCGIRLPDGLVESSKLPEPIFTPATKAETGHDENIDFARTAGIVGKKVAAQVRDLSIALYKFAADYALKRGIIIADTKFEFGIVPDAVAAVYDRRRAQETESALVHPESFRGRERRYNGQLLLIDEALTPDSSRFWPADSYAPGKPQPSFDKQFVRDYLETLDWNKQPPGPVLPDEIVRKTSEKYIEALKRLTG